MSCNCLAALTVVLPLPSGCVPCSSLRLNELVPLCLPWSSCAFLCGREENRRPTVALIEDCTRSSRSNSGAGAATGALEGSAPSSSGAGGDSVSSLPNLSDMPCIEVQANAADCNYPVSCRADTQTKAATAEGGAACGSAAVHRD